MVRVELTDVTQGYGRRAVLSGVSLEVTKGITSLLGPNGAGKSTLMRTLVTGAPPRAGSVTLGVELTNRRLIREARRHVGYLPQSFGFDPHFTVQEHVEYMAWLRGIPARGRGGLVRDALGHVNLLAHSGSKMNSLSGGQRQRAGIAGVIVGTPSLLVLDEPTIGLDPGQRAEFREVLVNLSCERILLSTHLTDDVSAVSDHVIFLFDGMIVEHASLVDVIERYGDVDSAYLAMRDGRVAP